jgi:hypothetical protein
MSRVEVVEGLNDRKDPPEVATTRVEDAPSRREMWSGIPWGFLGMIILVLGIESKLGKIGADYADFSVRDWKHSRKESERDLRRYQLLCFGDSQVKTAVVPQVIEAKTGWRAYNFALVGGQAPSSYFLLRRALAHGARPSAIVVDFLPPLLRIDLTRMERNFPELITLREAAELAWTDRNPGEFLSFSAAILVPSVRTRLSLRNGLIAALHGKSASRRGDAYFTRNWRLNHGAMLFPPLPFQQDPEHWYRMNYPIPWRCNPLHDAFAGCFLDLAAAHGIAVYWLLHPIAPTAQSFCEQRGQDARYDRYVRAALERYPKLTVIDGRHSGYGNTEFIDTVHAHAAAELTEDLADILRHPPGGTTPEQRWVALPGHREGPRTFPLETLFESAHALERIEKKRR